MNLLIEPDKRTAGEFALVFAVTAKVGYGTLSFVRLQANLLALLLRWLERRPTRWHRVVRSRHLFLRAICPILASLRSVCAPAAGSILMFVLAPLTAIVAGMHRA